MIFNAKNDMKKADLPQIEIRSATAGDSAEIATLYLASRKTFLPYAPIPHSDDSVRNWIKTTLIPSGRVDVAIIGDQIVGICATSHDGRFSWIDQLYLRPSNIRHGIGTILLENELAKLDRPVRLYTFQENHPARRFYERFGFVPIQFGDGSENEENSPDVLYELA